MSRQENVPQRIAVKKNNETKTRIAVELQMIEDLLDTFFERKEKSEQKKIIQEQRRLKREKNRIEKEAETLKVQTRKNTEMTRNYSVVEDKIHQFEVRL